MLWHLMASHLAFGKKSLFFFFFFLIFPPPGSEAKQKHFAFERLFALAFSSLCFRARLSPVPKWCSCAMTGESQGRARLSQVMHWGLGHAAGREWGQHRGVHRGQILTGHTCRWGSLQKGLAVNGRSPLLFLLIHAAAWSVCF